MGATDRRLKSVKVIRGRIVATNRVARTVTVVDEQGGTHTDIEAMPTYMSSTGAGQFYLPEVNSMVWLMSPSTGTPFVLGGHMPPSDEDGEETVHRGEGPVVNEGDQVMSGPDGNFIALRRGGVVEIGASPTAQRLYIPLQSVIRDIASGYSLNTAGGSLSLMPRVHDDTWGTESAPVEMHLQVKEFAGDSAPTVDVRLGRIAVEDDEAVVGGPIAGAVARVFINNRFRLWVDKEGNVQQFTHGACTTSQSGTRTAYYDSSYFKEVRGLLRQVAGSRSAEVHGNDELVASDRRVRLSGELNTTVQGREVRRVGGQQVEVKGSASRAVDGADDVTVAGDASHTVAGSRTTAVGGSASDTVAGVNQTVVANRGAAATPSTYTVMVGNHRIHTKAGKVQIFAGPSALSPLASIEVRPSGAIRLDGPSGASSVELNATGVRLKTPGGSVTLDTTGKVNLGPAGGGAVVTTLTHPVDRVTGTPILGSAMVSAGGVPSPVPVPAVFVPDVT
jgi:hypothetical protein